MSTASKVTFLSTCLVSTAVIYGVYRLQEDEREALHQGPIKDRERQRLKQEAKLIEQSELTPIQQRRQAEYELQKKQFEEYSSVQQVEGKSSDEQKDDAKKSQPSVS